MAGSERRLVPRSAWKGSQADSTVEAGAVLQAGDCLVMPSIPLTNGHDPHCPLLACAVDIPVPELLSGVYLLMQGDEVVYVGQTRDLMTRLMGHLKDGKQFDGVRFIAVEASLKDRTEAELIFRFKPKYNGRSSWKGLQYYPQSSRDAAAERRTWQK
jgi:hypothetical protein